MLNLRGNQRTQGEESRKEGGKIFGGGSRTPVAITLLIKDENYKGEKAEISYFDIGDYLSREQKLNILNHLHDISKVDFTRIIPNKFNDWIDQRDESFNKFVEIANKNTKFKQGLDIFECFSQGVVTGKDTWSYNFSKSELAKNIEKSINTYNEERLKKQSNKNYSLTNDLTKISWGGSLKERAENNRELIFDKRAIYKSLYRPFNKMYLYYGSGYNHSHYQLDKIYPVGSNLTITINDIGGGDFGAIICDGIFDIHLFKQGLGFPLYYYEKVDVNTLTKDSNAVIIDGYERKDAIRDWALAEFQKVYNDRNITKEDIFYYIYGLFHSKEYISKYKNNLSKMLPRIPYCIDFWGFSRIGRELAEIHLNYESIDIKLSKASYNTTKLVGKGDNPLFDEAEPLSDNDFKVDKMCFEKNVKITNKPHTIIYNDKVKITNIDPRAYDYVVNGKSAIAWVMERYQVKTDEDSGITNDPNLYSDDPRYIIDLMMKVIEVSLRSVELIEKLPALDILER